MSHADTDSSSSLGYLAGFILGGLCLGFGIRSLYPSFGWSQAPCLNCDLENIGFSGLDNIGLLAAADYSIGLIVLGILVLVGLNAGAWRRTHGY
jgi:hypothetical protein